MSMRKIYRKIAKENGVTLAEVKRDMQAAIDHAYKNTPDDGITGIYQAQVPRKGATPTSEEFISYAVKKIRDKQ